VRTNPAGYHEIYGVVVAVTAAMYTYVEHLEHCAAASADVRLASMAAAARHTHAPGAATRALTHALPSVATRHGEHGWLAKS
jgi:hypothetical protein